MKRFWAIASICLLVGLCLVGRTSPSVSVSDAVAAPLRAFIVEMSNDKYLANENGDVRAYQSYFVEGLWPVRDSQINAEWNPAAIERGHKIMEREGTHLTTAGSIEFLSIVQRG